MDLEGLDARRPHHDPVDCVLQGQQLFANWDHLLHDLDYYGILYDPIGNSQDALTYNSLRSWIPCMLSRVPALPEKVHPPFGDIDGGLCVHLSDNVGVMGAYAGVEVKIKLICRIIRFRVFPNDYEKVMKNVKRKLIENKILKSSIESIEEDTR